MNGCDRDITKQMLNTFPLEARDNENDTHLQPQKHAQGPPEHRLIIHVQQRAC